MAKQVKKMVGKEKVRVGVDGLFLRAAMGLALVQPGITVEDVGRELQKARVIKDGHELQLLRRACQIVDVGVEAMMDAVHEGVTEYELAAVSECAMRKLGADCFWWKTLVSSGPQAERWMASPTHRKIENGDLIITDLTPVYEGYAGDIARSFVCGKASAEQIRVFDLAERALDAAVSTLRDGVTCGEVMEVAAQQVQGSPYEQFYAGAGHGIGLYDDTYPLFLASIPQMHKMPASMLDVKLRAGTVVAIEIIITVPGLGGVRLEDNYVITTDQPERLTNAPLQLEI
jgi:Xaa-Pro aminopeptidase